MSASRSVDDRIADLRKHEQAYVATFRDSTRVEDRVGAGNYYLSRVRSGHLLPEAEWEVLKFIFRTYPGNSHIVEIGCGWAQLLALAAAAGYSCAGVDYSADRLIGAKVLLDLVDAEFPGSAGRLQLLRGDFPGNWDSALNRPADREGGPTIGFFSNLGLGRPPEFVEACVAESRRFNHVIMDVMRFFGKFPTLESQDVFIAEMKQFGLHYKADIFRGPGHRFIVLDVDASAIVPPRKPAGDDRTCIDLHSTPADFVRATIETLKESPDGGKETIIRVREDNTAANSHDVRLVSLVPAAAGSYTFSGTFRAGARKNVAIALHHRWQDQILFTFDVPRGVASIEQVKGDALRVRSLHGDKSGEWTHLTADIDVATDLDRVELCLYLADDAGKHYYDGDGNSGVDVRALTFRRI